MTPQLKRWLEDTGETISSLKDEENEAEELERRRVTLEGMNINELLDILPNSEINKIKDNLIDQIIDENWDLE